MQDLSTDIRVIDIYKPTQPSGVGPFVTSTVETTLNDSFVISCTSGPEGTALSTVNYLSFRLQHSDTDVSSDFEAVTQDDIVNGKIGANGQFWALDGNPAGFEGRGGNPGTLGLSFSVGYVGDKKYFRVVIVVEGTITTKPFINVCCIASKSRYFEYNDQFSHSTADDWRTYSEGIASLTPGGRTIYGGNTKWKSFVTPGDKFSDGATTPNYYTITRADSDEALTVEEDINLYVRYGAGSNAAVNVGDTVVNFSNTEFSTDWNDVEPGVVFYADVSGTIVNFGPCTINSATQLTLTNAAISGLGADANYTVAAGNPVDEINYKIYKKQWA